MLKRFFKDESGQGMVEYALIIALIAVVVIGAITILGNGISAKFGEVNDSLS
jgi:pilus assembly protein Flp/PilA